MLCNKLACALLLGNTVVAKPSPYTPLSTLVLGALLADVFPSETAGRFSADLPARRSSTTAGVAPTGAKRSRR